MSKRARIVSLVFLAGSAIAGICLRQHQAGVTLYFSTVDMSGTTPVWSDGSNIVVVSFNIVDGPIAASFIGALILASTFVASLGERAPHLLDMGCDGLAAASVLAALGNIGFIAIVLTFAGTALRKDSYLDAAFAVYLPLVVTLVSSSASYSQRYVVGITQAVLLTFPTESNRAVHRVLSVASCIVLGRLYTDTLSEVGALAIVLCFAAIACISVVRGATSAEPAHTPHTATAVPAPRPHVHGASAATPRVGGAGGFASRGGVGGATPQGRASTAQPLRFVMAV
jgi:lysylphosphatidylglycerol synthetase-like protein (DUF2156 family)